MNIIFSYLPNGCFLDSEIWNENYSLQKISSIITTGVNKGIIVGDLSPQLKSLQMWIFDFKSPEPIVIEKRVSILRFLRKKLSEVYPDQTSVFFVSSRTYSKDINLEKLRDQYVELGFEGLMIKNCSDGHTEGPIYERSIYKSKRNINTLKYKPFDKDIAEVIKVLQSDKKRDLCKLIVKDVDRNCEFGLHHGTVEDRRLWLKEPNLILGKKITYYHSGFTDNGKPHHPSTNKK